MRNGFCPPSAASPDTCGRDGICCRRPTTDGSRPAASRSGTRSPGRRPRPPPESATGTGLSTRTYALHANDRPESPSPPINLTVPLNHGSVLGVSSHGRVASFRRGGIWCGGADLGWQATPSLGSSAYRCSSPGACTSRLMSKSSPPPRRLLWRVLGKSELTQRS